MRILDTEGYELLRSRLAECIGDQAIPVDADGAPTEGVIDVVVDALKRQRREGRWRGSCRRRWVAAALAEFATAGFRWNTEG